MDVRLVRASSPCSQMKHTAKNSTCKILYVFLNTIVKVLLFFSMLMYVIPILKVGKCSYLGDALFVFTRG